MIKKNRVEKTFAISLLIHVFLFTAISFHFQKSKKTDQKIEIAFLQPKKLTAVQAVPVLKTPKASLKMATQVIKGVEEKISENVKFLSERNQMVDHQTRARKMGKFSNSKSLAKNSMPSKISSSNAPNKSPTTPESHQLKTLSDAEIAMRKALEQRPQISVSPQELKKNLNEEPDEEASATDDHIIADEGAETLINTREFKYYAYCKRIKDKIQVLWEPKIKAKVRNLNGGRSIASISQEKVTKTIIVLDSQGMLERVQVIGASGLEDLDESAIEAFRAASPFPNPPQGIIDPDGKIRIRWDFVLSEN